MEEYAEEEDDEVDGEQEEEEVEEDEEDEEDDDGNRNDCLNGFGIKLKTKISSGISRCSGI